MRLLLHSGATPRDALNLGWRHRLSAAACVLGVVALVARRPTAAAAAGLWLVVLNRSFYGLLLRRRGPVEAAAGVALHILHHLVSVSAVAAGLLERREPLSQVRLGTDSMARSTASAIRSAAAG